MGTEQVDGPNHADRADRADSAARTDRIDRTYQVDDIKQAIEEEGFWTMRDAAIGKRVDKLITDYNFKSVDGLDLIMASLRPPVCPTTVCQYYYWLTNSTRCDRSSSLFSLNLSSVSTKFGVQ